MICFLEIFTDDWTLLVDALLKFCAKDTVHCENVDTALLIWSLIYHYGNFTSLLLSNEF